MSVLFSAVSRAVLYLVIFALRRPCFVLLLSNKYTLFLRSVGYNFRYQFWRMRCNQRPNHSRFPVVRFIGAVVVVVVVGGWVVVMLLLRARLFRCRGALALISSVRSFPPSQKNKTVVDYINRYAHYTPSIIAYSSVYPHAHSHPHSHRTRP